MLDVYGLSMNASHNKPSNTMANSRTEHKLRLQKWFHNNNGLECLVSRYPIQNHMLNNI